MIFVGCTGGIGSGKSTVCAYFAERGARVIDADAIARRLSRPDGAAYPEIISAFGAGILGKDSEIDRAELASIVFQDQQKRARLESIVHPLVEAEIAHQLASIDEDAVVVLDHPLLVETNVHERFGLDGVIVVDVPEEEVIERLVGSRAMTPAQVRERIAAQSSRERRRNVADFIIINIGTLEELRDMAERAWEWINGLPDAR
ncbi:MAG TPA: dephospho-CoA kinase [Acidimicrobiales bacterium]|nr:dephospho-CoA kinase [Acidimicrobiales bacterium]